MNCETPAKCRIQQSGGMTTLAYYPPIYDGFGNNINPDMNTTTYQKHCSTCGKKWYEVWQNGKCTVSEVK